MITAIRQEYKHYCKTTFTLPDGTPMMFLELPWRDNEIGNSCIPEGIYVVDRDYTGRMQWYRFRDEEVSPRSAIEIHPANRINQLQGCLAPCFDIKGGERTSDPIAVDSIKACQKLVDWFGDNSFVLRITS